MDDLPASQPSASETKSGIRCAARVQQSRYVMGDRRSLSIRLTVRRPPIPRARAAHLPARGPEDGGGRPRRPKYLLFSCFLVDAPARRTPCGVHAAGPGHARPTTAARRARTLARTAPRAHPSRGTLLLVAGLLRRIRRVLVALLHPLGSARERRHCLGPSSASGRPRLYPGAAKGPR